MDLEMFHKWNIAIFLFVTFFVVASAAVWVVSVRRRKVMRFIDPVEVERIVTNGFLEVCDPIPGNAWRSHEVRLSTDGITVVCTERIFEIFHMETFVFTMEGRTGELIIHVVNDEISGWKLGEEYSLRDTVPLLQLKLNAICCDARNSARKSLSQFTAPPTA